MCGGSLLMKYLLWSEPPHSLEWGYICLICFLNSIALYYLWTCYIFVSFLGISSSICMIQCLKALMRQRSRNRAAYSLHLCWSKADFLFYLYVHFYLYVSPPKCLGLYVYRMPLETYWLFFFWTAQMVQMFHRALSRGVSKPVTNWSQKILTANTGPLKWRKWMEEYCILSSRLHQTS